MKITKIEINDFRSFTSSNVISLDNDGKNLFLFGENGSGKSSFCKALNLFFDATDKRRLKSLTQINFRKPVFAEDKITSNGSIKIHFSKDIFCLDENGFSPSNAIPYLTDIRRCKGFLEYKNLIPIYLYSNKEKNNLFRLFVEGPFSTLRNPRSNKLISTEWNNRGKIKLTADFYKGISELSDKLVGSMNEILNYFDPTLKIAFKSRKTWTTGELYLEVFINGKKLTNYGNFFNEAKLVALSISIYLAIILKQGKENESLKQKILVLDDIFIGMDLSNRIPLLKIVNNVFNDYQIFMTTFDESWYRMAEFYLEKSKWKFIKAYSDSENPMIPKSFLFDSQVEDYLEKAKFYFKRFDYPACANYQRKVIEKRLKEILPYHLLHTPDKDGRIRENNKLNTNFNNFISYLKSSKLNIESFLDFKLYAKTILNPLSHDNSSSLVYKKEVEGVFDIIEYFNLINIKTLKEVKNHQIQVLKLSVKNNENIWFQYKFQLLDNLMRIELEGELGYPPCRVILTDIKHGDSDWEKVSDEDPEYLNKKYTEICKKNKIEIGNYESEYRTNKNVPISEI
jgi:energy-coupling factor transporter ATP-binding protein EcfA2